MENLFHQAILTRFYGWTTLRIAIEQSPFSRQDSPLEELAGHTFEFFKQYGTSVTCSDLADNFDEYFQDQLDVNVEDGSFQIVANDLIQMFFALSKGDVSLLNSWQDKYKQQQLNYTVQDSSDEEEEMVETTEKEYQGPIIDEDGFELVTRKR